jgi:septal ring factor EnvC (AmiA/AmiB activator)
METNTQKSLAIAELNPIVTDIAAFAGTIEGLDVSDEETQGQVGDLVKMMNHRRKKLEDKRISLVKPLSGVVNEINALFKPPRDRIDEIVAIAKKKMNTFARAQAALANEKARQAREVAERERKEAEELAEALRKKAGQEAEPIARTVVEEAEKKVVKAAKPEASKVEVTRGREASVVVTKTWKGKVVDKMTLVKAVAEGRLPLNLVEPNMAAIQGVARELKRAQVVGGIEIWEDVGTMVR